MSWSLQLQHGDFTVTGAQLSTVTGAQKLVQDLTCGLLTPMGLDEAHRDFGSLLDGGTTPDGSAAQGVIGISDFNQASAVIQSEIMRIARNYQSQQLSRAKDDRQTYNRVSLSPAEVLLSIGNIAMSQQQDSIQVTVSLQTASGESIDIALPITSQGS